MSFSCWLFGCRGLVSEPAVGTARLDTCRGRTGAYLGLVATGGFVLGKLGVRWELGTSPGGRSPCRSVAFVVVQLLFRRKSEPETTSRTLGEHLLVAAGVVLGMAAGAGPRSCAGMHQSRPGEPGWDAPYHGNLIRWIADHGSVLPSTVARSPTSPAHRLLYPDTYTRCSPRAGQGRPGHEHLLNLGALMGSCVAAGDRGARDGLAAAPLAAAGAPLVSDLVLAVPVRLALARSALAVRRGHRDAAGRPGDRQAPDHATRRDRSYRRRGRRGRARRLHTSLAFVLAVLFLLLLLACAVRLEPSTGEPPGGLIATVVIAAVLAAPLVLPSLAGASGVTSAEWPSEATPAAAFTQTLTFSG